MINNKEMLNNSRKHFQVSSDKFNDCICIELLVYLFYLFLNLNLFIFVTGAKVVVARTALCVRAMQKTHLAGCNY